jgi:predicted DNA-binding transcriptional regulator YafY
MQLQTLREAVQSRSKLQVSYRDLAGGDTERPLGCLSWGKVWTLSAWCELRGDFRGFRVDRMSSVTVLDERFRDESGKTMADMLRQVEAEQRERPRADQ